jgi:hypothetical protein
MTWTGEATVSAAAVLLAIWGMRRQDQKDRKAVAEALKEHDRRMTFIMTEHPLHSHGEKGDEEPLTTRGLTYPKMKLNGS